MSFIDLFAWIVLLVLVATLVAIFVVLGMMPGRIAQRRGHPWAERVTEIPQVYARYVAVGQPSGQP